MDTNIVGFVWVVLRGFENFCGPEIDVFDNESAAQIHAASFPDAVVREESVAQKAWADEVGE